MRPPAEKFSIDIMCAAMAGAMKSVLETGATPARVRKLRNNSSCSANPTWGAATAHCS